MKEIDIPQTPGAYSEEIKLNDSTAFFSFEPDPDYSDHVSIKVQDEDFRKDTFSVGLKHGGFEDGQIFFSSLQDMEDFANEILNFVKRHR